MFLALVGSIGFVYPGKRQGRQEGFRDRFGSDTLGWCLVDLTFLFGICSGVGGHSRQYRSSLKWCARMVQCGDFLYCTEGKIFTSDFELSRPE